MGLLAAAEDAGVAGFQGQRRRVGGDVGAALIDDGHQPQGDLHLLDDKAVGAAHLRQHPARVIRQGGDGADAVGHGGQPLFVQIQAIQHHVGDMSPGGGHILCVGF